MQTHENENALYHFAGSALPSDEDRFELLCRILEQGTLSHVPHTPKGSKFGLSMQFDDRGRWIGKLLGTTPGEDPGLVFENVICMADLATAQLGAHMQKYSQFAVAIDKRFAAENGARPVAYFPYWEEEPWRSLSGQSALSMIEHSARRIAEDKNCDEQLKKLALLDFIGFLKPFNMSLPPDHAEQVYQEREWRVVGYLYFPETEIRHIVVPYAFVERTRDMFPHLAGIITAAPDVQMLRRVPQSRPAMAETA